MYVYIKRVIDIALVCLALPLVVFPAIIICFFIKLTSKGPVFYWSQRVGKGNRLFDMPKFRSMKIDAPKVATHLLDNPRDYLTAIGSFLRKTSLDEIPQLWSILKGDMSLVGPRPALFNQYDLVELRIQYGVDKLTPGLTGWAQINGRDSVDVYEKVQLDFYYLKNMSWKLDLKIILMTIYYVIRRVGISH